MAGPVIWHTNNIVELSLIFLSLPSTLWARSQITLRNEKSQKRKCTVEQILAPYFALCFAPAIRCHSLCALSRVLAARDSLLFLCVLMFHMHVSRLSYKYDHLSLCGVMIGLLI